MVKICVCVLGLIFFVPAASANVSTAFSGTADMITAFVDLPFETVERLLPDELTLGERRATHPVMLIGARHSNLKGYLPLGAKISGGNYNEVAINIPYVQIKNGDGQAYGYFKVLYLDSFMPWFAGNAIYSYPKYRGSFKSSGNSFTAYNKRGQSLMHVEIESVMDFDREKFESHLDEFLEFSRLPIVSITSGRDPICSRFSWDTKSVKAQPIHTYWKVSEPRSNLIFDVDIPGMDERRFGSVRFVADWLLSRPYACDRD